MQTKKSFCAFTLAEVLITLGIIGVVAAITIPVIINNSQNAQLNTAAKNAFAIFSEAIKTLKANDNDVSEFISTSPTRDNDFRDSLCQILSCVKKDGDIEIFTDVKYYKGGSANWPAGDFDRPGGVTKNGMFFETGLMSTCTPGTQCGWIRVDTNGINGPNMFGADVLDFAIYMKDDYYYLVAEQATCNIGGIAGCTYLRLYNPDALP